MNLAKLTKILKYVTLALINSLVRAFFYKEDDTVNIAICDDEEKYLNELKIHIEEYIKNNFLNAQFFTTTDPKELIESDTVFDLAFLDIQMDEADGITVAKELKKRNGKIILFFVTAFDEYQDEAMDLHIFRFFEKPFDVQRLYSSLDKAMEYLNESYVDIFLYNNKTHKKILVDDIVYIKRENRQVYFVTNDEEYTTRESLEEWAEKLPNTFFYLVHKSFLINLHYVTKYNYTELYLKDNIRISIASRKQADFHRYWFQYLRRR